MSDGYDRSLTLDGGDGIGDCIGDCFGGGSGVTVGGDERLLRAIFR